MAKSGTLLLTNCVWRLSLLFGALFGVLACSPPLGPKVFGECLISSQDSTHANDIRALILREADVLGLYVRDFTDIARRVTESETLVSIRARDRFVLPTYTVQFEINPLYGGSSYEIYAPNHARPNAVNRIVDALGQEYGFHTAEQNPHGGCDHNLKSNNGFNTDADKAGAG